MVNLLESYQKDVVPALAGEFGLSNPMAVPRVEKVVVNMGIGDAKESREEQERAAAELASITGQKPKVARARKSVAGFALRQGQVVGLVVTIRGRRMYDFLQKLFNIVLPRLRDFRGLSPGAFDKRGNYTIGVVEHTVFPEIDLGRVSRVRGLEVTIVTNASDQQKSMRLLEKLGMPFEKK